MNYEKQIRALTNVTGTELYDFNYRGGDWMTEAVETHETLANFIDASKNWHSSTVPVCGKIAGMDFLKFTQIQVKKGQPREALSIIDFGDVRIALPGTDLWTFRDR